MSLAKCVDIKSFPSENCIAALESYLERARKGEILAIAICSVNQDESINRQFAVDRYRTPRAMLLGAVELLKDQVLRSLDY